MINSRKLEDLDPATELLARKLIAYCAKEGIKFLITSTFRDVEQQNDIYAQGRTKPGIKVTNVVGGRSQHNYRNAFDICPYDGKGNLDWENTAIYKRIGKIGMDIGLEWGGSWKSFVDMPHFQCMQGKTLSDFIGMYPKGEAPARPKVEVPIFHDLSAPSGKIEMHEAIIKVPPPPPVQEPVKASLEIPQPTQPVAEAINAQPKNLLSVLLGIFKR